MLNRSRVRSHLDATTLQAIRAAATDCFPLMQRVRHHMHQRPELSMQEFATTEFLKTQVEELGIVATPTSRQLGLICNWESSQNAADVPRVGLRADIDALPIQSQLDAPYASTIQGVMHACGHDAHSSVVLGATAILMQLARRDELPVPVGLRVIFQPAEETSHGAPYMIEEGAIQGLEAVLAVHVDPNLPVGHVASRPGPFTAGCDAFEAVFTGRSGHSARPYQARDALAAASSWMQQVYERNGRVHDCRDPAVVSIGTFQAGVAPNVIADSATLTGTVRAVSELTRKDVFDVVHRIGQAVAVVHGCEFDLREIGYTPSLQNDELLTELEMSIARQLLGDSFVGEIDRPSMGAEDFAFFSEHLPCCMFRLGSSGLPDHGVRAHSSPLHAPDFDIDERSLAVGAQLLAATVIAVCASQAMG
ncbi:MAG: amidohydrolase [bacterium]|nr:amidohydrolase [bacterium]